MVSEDGRSNMSKQNSPDIPREPPPPYEEVQHEYPPSQPPVYTQEHPPNYTPYTRDDPPLQPDPSDALLHHTAPSHQPTNTYRQQPYCPNHCAYQQQGYVCVPNPIVDQQPQTQTCEVVVNKPPDYLEFSLLTCLCCFCPIGMLALCFSCGSKMAYASGDVNSAKSKGTTARTLNIIALLIGFICALGSMAKFMFSLR